MESGQTEIEFVYICLTLCLQCLDTVSCASGRASGL